MTTNTNKIVLTAIAAVAIITVSLVVSMQTSEKQAFAQQVPLYREKIITVTGTATTTASPDLLNIRFGVENEAKTAKEAINANSAAMTEVVDAVKKLGIAKEELSTSSLSIYPIYSDIVVDEKLGIHKSELTGYRASNILSIKTQKLDLAGGIIDAATEAGANRVDSVSFSLSPNKQLEVQDELLDEAVMNAKSKAEKALSPLGQKIIGVKMVSLSEFGYPPPPIPYYAGAEAAPSFKSTPVFSADQDVTTTANVMFLIGEQ